MCDGDCGFTQTTSLSPWIIEILAVTKNNVQFRHFQMKGWYETGFRNLGQVIDHLVSLVRPQVISVRYIRNGI